MKKSFDFQCQECGYESIELVEDPNEALDCPECDGPLGTFVRVWKTMPGITRASYIDSSKTSRSAEFADEKRAASLDVQAASLNPRSEEYKGLKKEAKELRKLK